MILTTGMSGGKEGHHVEVSFVPLPARPMVSLALEPGKLGQEPLRRHLAERLRALDPDSVVRVQLRGPVPRKADEFLSAAILRELAPPSMNISLAPHPAWRRQGRGAEKKGVS
jgi:hypothetical protein